MKQDTGLLFDLDGVIIDSEKEYSKIWHKINELWPTGISNLEQIIKGCTLTSILDTYFSQEDRDNVTAKLYELEGEMKYYYAPGAQEFLISVRNMGYKTALVTSSDNKKMAHLKEEMPDLLSNFDAVVTANDILHSKPNPEGYILGAKLIGISPEKCIVFEDSLQGIQAGKNAGARVIGLYSTLGKEKISSEVKKCIKDLSEINVTDLRSL